VKTYLTLLLIAIAVTAVRAGDRVYTAEQTSNTVSVIDPATNKYLGSIHLGEDVPAALSPLYRGELLVHGMGFSPDHKIIATIPVGQLPQALVYVPNATTDDTGNANLKPLGPATAALHVELIPPPSSPSAAHASVSINSLGLIDNLQIAATGLEPGKKYRLMLVESGEPTALVVLNAGIGGVSIAQTLGPLKKIVTGSTTAPAMKLEVRSGEKGDGDLILQQTAASPTISHS
jgi:YVTN family beta-propeller protein